MARRRRSFTPEFKAEAVRLCRVGDRSIGQVARDLDLTETCLRSWLKNAEQQPSELSTATQSPRTLADIEHENERLRQKVKRLEMDREILKKAAAFFAKESE
jgi:transposase-like protein